MSQNKDTNENPMINLDISNEDNNRSPEKSVGNSNIPEKKETVMNGAIELQPIAITDNNVLQNCVRILNNWSSSLIFSPTKTLGDDAQLVSAKQYFIYRLEVSTSIAQRLFALEKRPASLGRFFPTPKDIRNYALWEINGNDLTSNLRIPLPDTTFVDDCDICHGHKEIICPSCGGKKRSKCHACNGKGYHEYEEEARCPTCGGKGYINYGKTPCPTCTGGWTKLRNFSEQNERGAGRPHGGSGEVTVTKRERCNECGGSGKIECSECNGFGKVRCDTCGSRGRLEYTWAMRQEQKTLLETQEWLDEQAPTFSSSFYKLDQLPHERIFSIPAEKEQINCSTVPQLQCHFFSDLKSFLQQTQFTISNTKDIYLHRQNVSLAKYAVAIRYEYQFKGNTYVAWINPTNNKVAEYEDGLIYQLAESFVNKGRKAAKMLDPARAFYCYTKGYTCDSRFQEALKLAPAQLKRTSLFFLVPMWIAYVVFADTAFTNSGMAYVYAVFTFLLALLFGNLFAKDLALNLLGGCIGLIVAGSGVGYIASPNLVTEHSINPDDNASIALFLCIAAVLIMSFVVLFRKWRRKRILNWGEFLKKRANKPKSIRKMTESLKPSVLASILLYGLISLGIWFTYDNPTAKASYQKTEPTVEMEGQDTEKVVEAESQVTEKTVESVQNKTSAESKYNTAIASLKSNDISNGIRNLQDAAKDGYLPAIYQYGLVLLDGQFGVEKSVSEGIAYIQKAAQAGLSDAQFRLGTCYARGNGVETNPQTARFWFQKAADQGLPIAQLQIGVWLLGGTGGEKDIAKGIALCEKAAEQGVIDAYGILGDVYYEGKYVPKDYAKAFKYFKLSAEKGDLIAIYTLGICFKNGLGTEKNERQAFDCFRQAAEKNYIPAHYALGECYENGTGTDINYTKALAYYSATANVNNNWEDTKTGKTKNDSIAGQNRLAKIGKYWELANEKKEPQAQYEVGLCFYTGDGVKKDNNTALSWFQKSAQQNYAPAQQYLALLLPETKKDPDNQQVAETTSNKQDQKKSTPLNQQNDQMPSDSSTVQIDGGAIEVSVAAETAKQRDIAPQLQALMNKWSPDKLVVGKILPINGEQGHMLETKSVDEDTRNVTIYVEMSFKTDEFYSKLVPDFQKLLDTVSIKRHTVSREFEKSDRGGFWWGDYAQRDKSPYRLSAKVFAPEDMASDISPIAVFLKNEDDFTVYELNDTPNIISVLEENKKKQFVVTATFLDKDKKKIVSFSRNITTTDSDRIQSYFPLYYNLVIFPLNISGHKLMISPEFSGERNYEYGTHAFNYHEKLVRKVEGRMTADQLKRVSSVRLSFAVESK